MNLAVLRRSYQGLVKDKSRERLARIRRYAGRREFDRARQIGGRVFVTQQLIAVLCRWPRTVGVSAGGVRLHVRPGTSDIRTLEQIFVRQQYAIPFAPPPRSIVDAGANIGASALFFAQRWPEAQIAALEPESSNFALLQANICQTPSIVAIRGGLWSRDVSLNIVNPASEKWGFRLSADPESSHADSVPGLSVPSLLGRLHWSRLDLLKIDIEGAERGVFAGDTRWLANVGALLVEVHEDLAPGAMEAVQRATRLAGMTARQAGETWWFTRR